MSQQYITGLKAAYGTDRSDIPDDAVREVHGNSADVNHDFGGGYVWLVPVYTQNADDAANSIEIVIQGDKDSSKDDLAKGTHGDYRYDIAPKNQSVKRKLISVDLFRSGSAQSGVDGYDGISGDINHGRHGDYLYVIWKSVDTN